MIPYADFLSDTITGEATTLSITAAQRGIQNGLTFAIADALRALNGDGDMIDAGIALDIECLRARGAIDGFDYGGQIRQLQTMRDRMRDDGAAYLETLVVRSE